MKRILAVLIPPLAVCRYGCAGCCAAPIAVFWLTGIGGLVYGYYGGPAHSDGISWYTLGLGLALWGIAAVWALITLQNADDERCRKKPNPLCSKLILGQDESDPLDEIRKAR